MTTGPVLAQGDFLPRCLVPIFEPSARFEYAGAHDVPVGEADLIVVTQSCDLENRKAQFVALCALYNLAELSSIDSKFAKASAREEIRKGRYEGLHMLGSPTSPTDNLQVLIADFRRIYSLPYSYLSEHADRLGSRWRLQSPFLEHFSQSFARFFMRVGLPSAIPPFK